MDFVNAQILLTRFTISVKLGLQIFLNVYISTFLQLLCYVQFS